MHNSHKKIRLLVITGPTASGKTGLGVQLAKKYNGEVISADSMQIYQGMEIGTAAATTQEQDGVKHHMLGFVHPNQEYSVSKYKNDAVAIIRQIAAKGKLPIIVGGTGLYVDAVLYDMDFTSACGNDEIRSKWQSYAEQKGVDKLHEQLIKVDPIAAERLHPNDVKRIIRALEVFEITGVPMSGQAVQKAISSSYEPIIISLECQNRAYLYDRINRRVDIMVENGLVDEVKALLEMGVSPDAQSMKAIGYRQLVPCLLGSVEFSDAIDEIKMESRRYAKRQLTWMRKRDCIRIDIENKALSDITAEAISKLQDINFV